MGKIEELALKYERHIKAPWPRTVAGAQRVVIVVYDKELERTFRARKADFQQRTEGAGHRWLEFDCTPCFAQWMAAEEYRENYFEEPEALTLKLESQFLDWVAERFRAVLRAGDSETVVAITGAASLYGFLHISDLVRSVEHEIQGRLVVFFPGSKDGNNYRFLDVRDGWNYLAQGITLHGPGENL
jgi:Domain of unknown function (DUF1788)